MIDYSYVECSMASNGASWVLGGLSSRLREVDERGTGQRLPQVHSAGGRKLVRLLGLLLYVRGLVGIECR